jgi:hypothetical protein
MQISTPTPTSTSNNAPLQADYLVIGAGATAMAFVDTLLSESADATVLMVDRQHRPGGHWNAAYPFVRVHQPSAFYGVASRELSSGGRDRAGINVGMDSLASGAEVLAHFEQVMQQRFLPSGRVRWLPMSEVLRDSSLQVGAQPHSVHSVRSLTSGQVQTVHARKVVDATHAQTAVPSTHPPKYSIAPGLKCIPLNDLPKTKQPYANYTVVGAGKTGMDAVLWLLENGVPPKRIRWVMPRDAWFINRTIWQTGLDNFERSIGAHIGQFDSIIEASSVADLFTRLEARAVLMRIDAAVQPTAYHCAVVSPPELAQMRRIGDIVRLGRLQAIEPTRLVLDQGTLAADADTLYIDCSARAIIRPPVLPVFDDDRINLFFVRTCQPLFSAAVIAYVESHVTDITEKNALCTPVPTPELPIDWLRMWLASLANGGRWRQHAGLNAWLATCRLNGPAVLSRVVTPDDAPRMALLQQWGAKGGAAAAKLQVLLAGI